MRNAQLTFNDEISRMQRPFTGVFKSLEIKVLNSNPYVARLGHEKNFSTK